MITQNKKIIVAIVILTGLGYQTFIDIYLPGLPAIATYYKTGSSAVQMSMTLYLLGSGVAFFFYGTLSDIYGRKKFLLAGALICFGGTFLSLTAYNINLFLVGRLLQGVGLGSAVLACAVLIDALKGKSLITAFILYNIAYSAIPVLAPYFGGLILKYYDWQIIFAVLLAYICIISFLIAFVLPETLRDEGKSKPSFYSILAYCKHILLNQQFLWITIVMTCAWGCIIVFNVLGPFIFQKIFLFTPYQYGVITLLVGLVYMISTIANKFLLKYFEPTHMIFISVIIASLCSSVFVLFSILTIINMPLTLVVTLLLAISSGLLFVNGMTLTLPLFPFKAGLTAALQGGICVLMWMGMTGLVAVFAYSQLLLAIAYWVLSIVSFIILIVLSIKIDISVPDHAA